MRRTILIALVATTVLGVAAPASAATTTFAYLDPATGTLIVSAIIGGFAAIAMFVKRYFYLAKDLMTGSKSKSASKEADIDPVSRATEDPATPE
jgi:hypothetical protein